MSSFGEFFMLYSVFCCSRGIKYAAHRREPHISYCIFLHSASVFQNETERRTVLDACL